MKSSTLLAGALLAAHAWAAMDAARRQSPTWDEIVYPAAGVAQWRTGSIAINNEHAFLSKLLTALPLLPLHPDLPAADPSWNAGDAHRFGYRFTFNNRVPARRLIFWSRIPAVLFSVLTGLLLFLWMRSLWGGAGALWALLCFAAVPILRSRASLALLESPMYFFVLGSLFSYDRWMRTGTRRWLAASGAAGGLALLCKLPALPLFPALFVMELLGNPRRGAYPRRAVNILWIGACGAGTVLAAYAPWDGAWDGMRRVVMNLRTFEIWLPYFWNGRFMEKAPAFYSLGAFALKAPLGVLALAAMGAAIWKKSTEHVATWRLLLAFAGMCLLPVLFFSQAVTSIQFSCVYLALAALAAGLDGRALRQTTVSAAALVLGLYSAVEIVAAHPNTMAYFNPLAGGSRAGHRWLTDSDQDWGQWLPALADHWVKEGRPPLLLCYSGAADPAAYGLAFQDLVSPALFVRESADTPLGGGEDRLLLAVGTRVLQVEPSLLGWLAANRRPSAVPDPCVFVYDLSGDAEACRWLAHVYLATHRPGRARWAIERAQRLEPGRPEDEVLLSTIQKTGGR